MRQGKDAERMSAVDRAWLEMDEPNNPMVVNAVLELSRVGDTQALLRQVVERLLQFRRFRQYADRSVEPPVWRDAGDLSMAYHLRIFHLTEDTPDHDLAHAVAREVERSLDPEAPLWQLTLFLRDNGRATVLFRAHHAIADGVALVGVLMRCTDGQAQTTRGAPALPDARKLLGAARTRLRWLRRLALSRARRAAFIEARLREGRESALAVGRVLALPDDNPVCLRQPLSGKRQVAWTAGLPLAPIKARARRLDVKLNDFFLAALAGAIGAHLAAAHGSRACGSNLRISIPVNLRQPVDGELGNCFGLVLLDLPLGIDDWRERLHLVATRMAALKRSPEARATLLGLAAAGHLPVSWEKALVNYLAGKSAAVVSNLPGPRTPLSIAGTRIDKLVFWPPQTGGIGVGISLFSYNGGLTVGVSADRALIADPQDLVARFEDELARMLHPRKHAAARAALPSKVTPIRTARAKVLRPSPDRVRAPDPARPAQVLRG
jgi:diacylglycerol O-acyltransferase / wax synthase